MLSLNQRLTQQQKLSPQQIQYQKLLQLNTLALEQRIKTELELNPILEEELELTQEQDEQPGHEALRDQTMQNSFSQQQQGSSDSYTSSNNPDADEINKWLINNNNRYRNISELQESFSANDSINMLA